MFTPSQLKALKLAIARSLAPVFLLLEKVDNLNNTLLKNTDALNDRLGVLEGRGALEYRGVYSASSAYVRGNFVTHKGSMWHCDGPCLGITPGEGLGIGAWRLAVKRGKNADVDGDKAQFKLTVDTSALDAALCVAYERIAKLEAKYLLVTDAYVRELAPFGREPK